MKALKAAEPLRQLRQQRNQKLSQSELNLEVHHGTQQEIFLITGKLLQ